MQVLLLAWLLGHGLAELEVLEALEAPMISIWKTFLLNVFLVGALKWLHT